MPEVPVVPEAVAPEPVVQEEPVAPEAVVQAEPVAPEPVVQAEPEDAEAIVNEAQEPVDAPLVDLTNSNENPELVQSLAKVVDYISEKVADKVASQVANKIDSSELVESSQNGFDAVTQAANVMADSNTMANGLSGGRKKRTRKFRLVKKNKTRSK